MIFRKQRLYHPRNEILGLPGRASGELFRADGVGKLLPGHAEERVRGDAVQQVVLAALLLHDAGSLHGMDADALVELLAVRAALHGVHHDVFRRHERQLAPEMLRDHAGIHDEAVRDVGVQVQDPVHGEERLGDAEALVGGIVQRALEPLGSGRDRGVQAVDDDVAGERRDPLAAHRVPLVSHRGGADLMLLKRLLHLFQMLEQADVVRKFCRTLGDPAQHRQNPAVQLAGIGLPGNGEAGLIPHFFRDFPVERADLFVIPVEQLEKAGLRPGRPFRAEELHLPELVLHILQIHDEILNPERGALPHRGGLRRLKMRECQRWKAPVAHGEAGEHPDHPDQLGAHEPERLGHHDDVGVVADIAGGGAQVDDGARLGALPAERVNVGHHVVPHLPFPGLGHLVIDIVGVPLHLVDLLLGNRKPQLLFGLRQSDPQAPPCPELLVGRKQELHFLYIKVVILLIFRNYEYIKLPAIVRAYSRR